MPKERGGQVIHQGPALIGAVEGPDGRFSGIQRTWIDLARPGGKALIVHPSTGEILPSRKARGSVKGGTILLAKSASPPSRLFLGEGIETVLSIYCALLESGFSFLDSAEFRAGVSLGNISGKAAGRVRHPTETRIDSLGRIRRYLIPDNEPSGDSDFPIIQLAGSVRELVLLGDGDSEAFFTRMALERAGKRFARAYPRLLIVLWSAVPGTDFNDLWLAHLAAGSRNQMRISAHGE